MILLQDCVRFINENHWSRAHKVHELQQIEQSAYVPNDNALTTTKPQAMNK
jgi:hypothetical protein